jgi:hemerythrin-like domain-containing protein
MRKAMSIITLMHEHHTHCDDLFVTAEDACRRQDWEAARVAVAAFAGDTETHFRAEEELLFPAFEQTTGMVLGPTQMMRMEHAQMRGLLAQMEEAINARDSESYAGAAETLLVLMQQHNMKEENILYPMCEQALPVESMAESLRERLGEPCPV